jgi:hypothetical protein
LVSAIVALAVLFGLFSFQNSSIVTSVAIRLNEGVREHRDPTILGLGREHQLPDYRVKLHVTKRFLNIDLGTKLNTSATNWLEYPVKDIVPLRHVQEVLIVEDDKVASDILERFQIVDQTAQGKSYHCRLNMTRSFEAGMQWFFSTPVGKAVSIGIIILVVLIPIALLKGRS